MRFVSCTVRRALFGLACSIAAGAASAGTDDIQARYEKERAACVDGSSQQDRATCLREAGAARDQARQGALSSDDGAMERNALVRCKALPAADQADCKSRVQGQGRSSGSVKSGGIYKETETRSTEPSPAAK